MPCLGDLTDIFVSSLFTELVTDALVERTYDADIAGMSYRLDTRASGLVLSVDGYSDKLSVLLETILKEITTFSVNQDRFIVQKEQVRNESTA